MLPPTENKTTIETGSYHQSDLPVMNFSKYQLSMKAASTKIQPQTIASIISSQPGNKSLWSSSNVLITKEN